MPNESQRKRVPERLTDPEKDELNEQELDGLENQFFLFGGSPECSVSCEEYFEIMERHGREAKVPPFHFRETLETSEFRRKWNEEHPGEEVWMPANL